MDEIVSSVQHVADIMSEITAASQEQSAGIEQVNLAITQMDEMTQQNAALVEQAAAAAESMEEQAYELGQAVSVFKLVNNAHMGIVATEKKVPKQVKKHVVAIAKTRDINSHTPKKFIASSVKSKSDDWEEF